VDPSGVAHILFSDTTSSPTGYYRIFYMYGRGTVFSGVNIPFTPWDGNSSWQKESSVDYGSGYIHVAFSTNKYDPQKDNGYSNLPVAPPPTPTPVPPPCPSAHFTDVCPGSTFYTNIMNLVNANVISGYNTSPPCPNNSWIPCFFPANTATRGQVSKIVTLGAALPLNTIGGPHFQDVPPASTFYTYTETMYNAGIIGGYPCGGLGEPCVPPGNLPYFRPNNNVTRGQLSKMAALAFDFNEPVSGQTFQDVPPASTFYTYIQRLTGRAIINGYPCGGTGEPCVPPGNLPYFRPNTNITRGQLSKIVDLCRQQPPPTPTPTATPTVTGTPPTATGTPVPPDTATATVTGTPPTATETPTSGPTQIPTNTPIPTATDTPMVRS
jgi:hypothetical protein